MTRYRVWNRLWFQQALLFIVSLLVLLKTMAPTIYYLVDSSEFAIGASTLGLVHSPGYGLYLLLAHLFTRLPFGDVAFRVNLFSVLVLALTAPILFTTLAHVVRDRLIGAASTLIFIWSYYVWLTGVAAEIYAPQILTLAAALWALAVLVRFPERQRWMAPLAGVLFGLAVAIHPSSGFFAPGVVVAFRLAGVSWKRSIVAGILAAGVFLLSLLYFPVAYVQNPEFNTAGEYAADGTFDAVNLTLPQGILWLVSGAQFGGFFFSEGIFPSLRQIGATLGLFWSNFLGFGFILGLIGVYVLYRTERRLFVIWLVLFAPYTYFYMTYGAPDSDTMFGPSFLLWTFLIACALQWFTGQITAPAARRGKRGRQPEPAPQTTGLTTQQLVKLGLAVALPAILLVVNWRVVDASGVTGVRQKAETIMEYLPENAIVFGNWIDIIALQYLQIIEQERPDLMLYNLYYFDDDDFYAFLTDVVEAETVPVVIMHSTLSTQAKTAFIDNVYQLTPILAADAESTVVGYRITEP